MRFFSVIVFATLVGCAGAGLGVAQTSRLATPSHQDLLPSALEVYASSEALTSQSFGETSSVRFEARQDALSRPLSAAYPAANLGDSSGENGGGGKYLPVLFSALMPGTGELYLGYKWRGAGLIALEVAAWTGYFYYRDKGLDSRESYENFADTYWSIDKWIDDHPLLYPSENLETPAQMDSVGMVHSGSGDWPGFMPWVSKEEDKQHFYENVGKYDWFISGWRDYDPDFYDPGAEIPFQTDTALRDQYREMRNESNDQLETADTFIYVSLGVRVFSIVETLFLVRSSGGDDSGDSADLGRNRLHLRTRARGFDGGEIFLQYSFK